MKRAPFYLPALILTLSVTNSLPALAADVEPGGDAQAAQLTIQEPDEYAWRLFLWINRQAKPGTAGEPDPTKATVLEYDEDTDVVWETWALASRDGQPEAEVFLANGATPPEWADLPRDAGKAAPKKLDRNRTNAHRLIFQAAQMSPGTLAPQFVQTEPESDEVRMNQATFEFVRDNHLYSREGLAAAFAQAKAANDRDFVQFPFMSKEVKARWEKINESQKSRYHWRRLGSEIYGLKAFHIITKDLPMWFWTDFIHTDLEAAEPDPCQDATTRGAAAPHGQNGIRNETVGSKWEHYRLKGSQVAFTDARGKPTILGNQLIEFGNAATSSCLTCHAGAGVANDGSPNAFDFIAGVPPAGVFGTGDTMAILQMDFLYSVVLRAHSQSPAAPSVAPAINKRAATRQRILEGYPDRMAARLALRNQALTVTKDLAAAHGVHPFSVLHVLKRWDVGSTVTVAFKGGSTELHAKIANATRDWTDAGNIHLDFGLDPNTGNYRTWSSADTTYKAAIRVSFDDDGYWSNVGRDSRDPVIAGPGEASMNLEGFDTALPGDWRGVVLHEFGHALGFEHEHQSPAGTCDLEFRWNDDGGYVPTRDSLGQFIQDSQGRRPGLYTLLSGPPNKWNADTVNFNLKQLPNSSAFLTSAFDRSSIMKYYFEAWMFKDGESSSCFSDTENEVLSAQDIAGIKRLYPHAPAEIQKMHSVREELLDRIESLNVLPKTQLQNLR